MVLSHRYKKNMVHFSYLICLRHLIGSREVTNLIFPKRLILLHKCPTCSELPTNILWCGPTGSATLVWTHRIRNTGVVPQDPQHWCGPTGSSTLVWPHRIRNTGLASPDAQHWCGPTGSATLVWPHRICNTGVVPPDPQH